MWFSFHKSVFQGCGEAQPFGAGLIKTDGDDVTAHSLKGSAAEAFVGNRIPGPVPGEELIRSHPRLSGQGCFMKAGKKPAGCAVRQVPQHLPGEGGGLRRQEKLVLCPGHSDVKEAAFLLIRLAVPGRFQLPFRDGREYAVQHIQQINAVILQALTGTNGGEGKSVSPGQAAASNQGSNLLQMPQQEPGGRNPSRKQGQDKKLPGIRRTAPCIPAVTHVIPDPREDPGGAVTPQRGKVDQTLTDGGTLPGGEMNPACQHLQKVFTRAGQPEGVLGLRFCNTRTDPVIESPEQVPVRRKSG